MELSLRIINKIKGAPRKQKAVAIALCLKHVSGRDSIIRYVNPNKIHTLIGISPNTFTTYLPLMLDMGLVSFDGANNEHLVIRCLHSSHKSRNIDIHRINFKSFKEAYYGLRAFLFLLIQKRKDFIRRTLQLANNPYPGDDCKRARQKVKSLVKRGLLKTWTYVEKGLSLKRIAKETGNCIKTVQNIVGYAIHKRWCRKKTHFLYFFMRGINYMEVEGSTFTTLNYAFKVAANTYTLSRGIKGCL